MAHLRSRQVVVHTQRDVIGLFATTSGARVSGAAFTQRGFYWSAQLPSGNLRYFFSLQKCTLRTKPRGIV